MQLPNPSNYYVDINSLVRILPVQVVKPTRNEENLTIWDSILLKRRDSFTNLNIYCRMRNIEVDYVVDEDEKIVFNSKTWGGHDHDEIEWNSGVYTLITKGGNEINLIIE
jgi:hypothetical protein